MYYSISAMLKNQLFVAWNFLNDINFKNRLNSVSSQRIVGATSVLILKGTFLFKKITSEFNWPVLNFTKSHIS